MAEKGANIGAAWVGFYNRSQKGRHKAAGLALLFSSKTTEIYTHVLSISNKNIQSPLDGIDEILNLVTAESKHPVDNRDIDAIG